jgi:general secretion pathway protein G
MIMRKETECSTKSAFTMIELVFVIVVLGILAAIAVPRLAATRTDAQISKGAADVASIRSGIISVRQKYLLRGNSGYINKLSSGGTTLFDGNGTAGTEILMYPIVPKNAGGHWTTASSDPDYYYRVGNQTCKFVYTSSNGKFDLDTSYNNHDYCKALIGQ